MDLAKIQSALAEHGVDGWLLYDFRGLNVLARRVLGIAADAHLSRRWFYFIPTQGTPQKLVHKIEPRALDAYPGEKRTYLRWQELEDEVGQLVAGRKKIAMEYVARNANPYVSRVDAGTVELVRSFGVEIVSSGDLVQEFEATWDEAQWAMHQEAAIHTNSAFGVAFDFIRDRVGAGKTIREVDVQALIMEHFRANGLVTDHPPICAVGPHSGDPHYAPSPESNAVIGREELVLIDLWAKLERPRSVYSDLTRTCYTGKEPPAKMREVFEIVRQARDAAIARVKSAFAAGETLHGWQVDEAARQVIERAGYGEYFCHRTGHSIGQEVHGNGANMDGLETREDRRVLKRTCFSIEPGIYLKEFGIRSEIDVFVDAQGEVHVTGGALQTEILRLF